MSPFKDQDHDSGRLDRMWQVTVLWVAALPAFVNQVPEPLCQVCTPCSSCPLLKQS